MPWRFGSSSADATAALNFGVLSSVLRRQIASIIVLFSAQTFWENEGTKSMNGLPGDIRDRQNTPLILYKCLKSRPDFFLILSYYIFL